jgi:hypothetical protein
MYTLNELMTEARRLSVKIDEGVQALAKAATESAEAERQYRKEKARQWTKTTGGTAQERAAIVDANSADLRYVRDVSSGIEKAALEALRSRRQQLSALQSILAAHKAEAEHDKFGPG